MHFTLGSLYQVGIFPTITEGRRSCRVPRGNEEVSEPAALTQEK